MILYDFIQIVTTGELGDITPDNWEKIYAEYSEISSSSMMNQTFDLAVEINYLNTRIRIVQSIVNRLYMRKNDELIQLLKDMRFFFNFTDVSTDLQRVTMQLKGDEMRLNKASAAYEELTEKDSGKATEFDWYEMLSAMGQWQPSTLNPKTATVMEYCVLEKRFRNHIEQLKSKAARHG